RSAQPCPGPLLGRPARAGGHRVRPRWRPRRGVGALRCGPGAVPAPQGGPRGARRGAGQRGPAPGGREGLRRGAAARSGGRQRDKVPVHRLPAPAGGAAGSGLQVLSAAAAARRHSGCPISQGSDGAEAWHGWLVGGCGEQVPPVRAVLRREADVREIRGRTPEERLRRFLRAGRRPRGRRGRPLGRDAAARREAEGHALCGVAEPEPRVRRLHGTSPCGFGSDPTRSNPSGPDSMQVGGGGAAAGGGKDDALVGPPAGLGLGAL
ncbi:unnamed protein product, partial [Prorocentrum cordatum]